MTRAHAGLSFAVPSTVVGDVVDGALEKSELLERDAEQTLFTEPACFDRKMRRTSSRRAVGLRTRRQ